MPRETKILIVAATYYEDIADELISGAKAVLAEAGADCDLMEVPGAFEIPAAISMVHEAARRNTVANAHYDGYIALGCVIRGETSHYDYVCGESARGIARLCLNEQLAIGNGILTVENRDQAMARARMTEKNKGGEVANATLRMIAIRRQLGLAE